MMHIKELAEKLGVDARELAKVLDARELMYGDNVKMDTADSLIYLHEHYFSGLVTPQRGDAIPLQYKTSPVIYFLYNGSDTITYVGKSFDVLDRLSSHVKVKQFDGIFVTPVSRADIEIIELCYIFKYQPYENIAGKNKIELVRRLINLL